jgi:hypothetical protein
MVLPVQVPPQFPALGQFAELGQLPLLAIPVVDTSDVAGQLAHLAP